MTTPLITPERLRALLHYDPETGIFVRRTRKPRAVVGCLSGDTGYLVIVLDRKQYYLHRLAWLYTHDRWPQGVTDHINRVRTDNRIANLREVTRGQNNQNSHRRKDNTSGHPGVTWFTRTAQWRAYIQVNGKVHSLGYFSDFDAAVAARKTAEAVHHTHRPT